MRISLYTLITSDFSLPESVAMAAAAGCDAIDLRQGRDDTDLVHLPRAASDAEVRAARGVVEEAGLHVSGLTTYYVLGRVGPEASADLDGLRHAFDLAAILGARCVRCSGPRLDLEAGYEASRAAFREQAIAMAAAATAAGVTLTVEQHSGSLFASAGQILDMLRGLEPPGLGIVYDPGNCLWEGYERPSVQLDMIGRWIHAVHVKNAMPQPAPGPAEAVPADSRRLDQGLLDWPAIVAGLARAGYDGYLTLEDFFGGFPSVAEKIAWDVAYLREALAGGE